MPSCVSAFKPALAEDRQKFNLHYPLVIGLLRNGPIALQLKLVGQTYCSAYN